MKQSIIAISLLMLFACSNNSSVNTEVLDIPIDEHGNVDSSKLAIITFESEVFDFGQIQEGEKVAYSFKFTNTGKVPLIVASAHASCGCTVPKVSDKPIAPGESGKIEVVFNSENRMGIQNKTITVLSNTIPKEHQVFLRGEVLPKK
jgi:hypothetical protein